MIPFDARGSFRPAAEESELRRLAIRGATATVSASGLGLAVQVLGTVLLARLLTPADFGVVAMGTTFSLFLASVGLNGFTEAVIQFEEISHDTASNLFWINSLAGLVLSVGFAWVGTLLARFYRDPLVADVTRGLAVGVFIGATSVIHLALLKRSMSFGATAAIELLGRIVYTAVGIVLAWRGWGYFALVTGIIAQQLSMSVGAWWFCRWVPSLPRRTAKTGAIVVFATKVYGQFGLRYCTRNIDNLLVGWRFNAATLGIYKKAYDLFALSASQLTGPLNNVALAALSRLNQNPDRYTRYLTTSLGVISLVGMAMSADLTLVGRHVVRLVLGARWAQSGEIFELFGPGVGAMLLCTSVVAWIHLSIGQPGRLLRWSVVEFTVTISLFLAALRWGPSGVAAAWSISYWILLIPGIWYAGRPVGFGVSALMGAIWRFVAAALAAGLATAAILRGTAFWGTPSSTGVAVEAILVISLVFVILYLGMVALLHRGWAPLQQVVSILSELMPARGAAKPAAEPVEVHK
jgi:PST family polysaccharide transporter